ncbi:hypothetical protein L1D14_26550 [Vibrio tubiashii]|uniref:hypothetical protein n=1 Tax=Vibrio tubiashii TaxID=29498 RepID=UPI001EFECEDA|nr:hypothetical protein [Vibrio tubiashii]MCG9579767.1 hypothetical protein [Vibrio tubiashii]
MTDPCWLGEAIFARKSADKALKTVIKLRKKHNGLIFHNDQGTHHQRIVEDETVPSNEELLSISIQPEELSKEATEAEIIDSIP